MAAINPLARELVLKIVFYGPGLGGKTTTLQHIHDMARPEHRGKMVSLATAVDRTLYFDFLPLRVPKTRGMSVRLQLFTVPGQVYYNSTRKLVLTGADGIVFVADSQSARHDANLESLENLIDNLREQKRDLAGVPHVLLYNKRDLDDVLPVEELERELNVFQAPSVATVATQGTGVFEGLGVILRSTLDAINRSLPAEGSPIEMPLALPEGGLAQALRGDGAIASVRDVSIVSENVLERPDVRWSDPPAPPSVGVPTAVTAPALTSDQRRTTVPPAMSLSFAALWGDGEREVAREIERDLGARHFSRALESMDALATRVLASAGSLLRTGEAPRDAALLPLLLGVPGERYLAFRALLRDARAGVEVEERGALAAYVFVLELRLARARLAL